MAPNFHPQFLPGKIMKTWVQGKFNPRWIFTSDVKMVTVKISNIKCHFWHCCFSVCLHKSENCTPRRLPWRQFSQMGSYLMFHGQHSMLVTFASYSEYVKISTAYDLRLKLVSSVYDLHFHATRNNVHRRLTPNSEMTAILILQFCRQHSWSIDGWTGGTPKGQNFTTQLFLALSKG